jgi:hypothetical protein
MYCHTTQRISLRHLGKETESMVYAGEASLRTGHCSLNSYLHGFNMIIEDPTCECGDGKEAVTLDTLLAGLFITRKGARHTEKEGGSWRREGD